VRAGEGAMDFSPQTGLIAWLVSLLANAHRIFRTNDAEAQRLRVAQTSTESANRTKSEFLASMSHELRTPLNAIIGFSDVMRNELYGPIPDKYRDYAHDIFQSGNYLLELINDILDLSKLEAGKLELHEEEFDLAMAVNVSLHLVEAQARKSQVELIEAFNIDLPLVRGDSRRLRQVFINLLSNAVKFTPEGGYVRVSAQRCRGGLALTVDDTGIGIAPDQIGKVLEPFGQVKGERIRKHDGTGLGLPIAKHLVELHGGVLTIESRLGQGTTVRVVLPSDRLIWAVDEQSRVIN
jgi:signal transduction histidine kinase